MPRRKIVPSALVAVIVAGVATWPAAAGAAPVPGPADRGERFALPSHRVPEHAMRAGSARDLLWRGPVPGPPTWPVDPEPLNRPADPAPPTDEERSGWLLTCFGLVGAGIAAGGAAGLTRRYRIRARQLAV